MIGDSIERAYLDSLGKGDKEAFASLYKMYAGKCVNFALMLTKDDVAAKDITHDVFVKVWSGRQVLSKVDSFSSYLFRMMRNEVLNYFEKEQIKRRFIARQTMEVEEFRAYVDEKVDENELQLLIARTMNKMPSQRREVFAMSRYKGVSNKEIANLLGISIRTVEKHISNALSDIREELKEELV